MSKHWFDYTPVGLLTNGATKLLGLDSNPFTNAFAGVSDTLFGTTYNQERLQQQQMEFNAAQAQLNRDWQKQMLDYQNVYNSPSSMMQRYRDAGLNPSLMMSGSAPAIESASPSGGSAATSALSSAQHGNVSLSDLLIGAQARNLEADSKKKEAEIPLIQQELDNAKSKGEEIRQNVELLKEERLVKHEEFNRLLNENNFFVETWANRSDLVGADAAKARLEVRTFRERFEKEMNNLEQSTYLMYSQAQLNDEQKKQVIEITKNLRETFRIISKQADILEKYGDAEQVVGLISQSLNAINSTLSSIVDVVTAGKRPSLNVRTR